MRIVGYWPWCDNNAAGMCSNIVRNRKQQRRCIPYVFRESVPVPILFGKPAGLVRCIAQRQSRFTYSTPHRKGTVICNHACTAFILFKNFNKNSMAFIPGEIDINIGRVCSCFIEKAFKKQFMCKRINMRYAKQI